MPPVVDVRYRAAATIEKHTIVVESELREKHPNLLEVMVDSLKRVRACKWRVCSMRPEGACDHVTLKSPGDLRAFLVSVRRTHGDGFACSLLNQIGPKSTPQP